MASIIHDGLVILILTIKCLAGLNVPSAVSNFTSRPLEKQGTDNKEFIQIARKNGYRAEKHQVITDDGYILTMFRIPPGNNCNETKKTPMLLMHGLLQSAECFVDSGPEAPAFILAQECYDLWFGNVRRNYHSRKHVDLDPDKDLKFWKFSVDEMGLYDIPAMIDYVLAATNTEKLLYVGFSQGSGSFFIMNSERSEYADKIKLFIGLAPGSRQYYTKSVAYRAAVNSINALQRPLEAAGVWEILSKGLPIQGALSTLCQVELLAAVVCGLSTTIIDSAHPDSITPEIEKRIYEHLPAGTSVQNLAWYGQAMNNLKYVKFDYGSQINLEVYGTPQPPEYNLKATTMPTVIFHGLSDHLVDNKDADWCVSQLPNVLEYIVLEDPLWNHLDMTYSRYWRKTIYLTMKKYLDKYEKID